MDAATGSTARSTARSTAYMGSPLTLIGQEVKAGDKAPEFEVITSSLAPYSSNDGGGTTRLIASLASVDTPVCDMEIRRLSQELKRLPGVELILVSADLPFAQARWAAANGIENATMLSDHRELSFGRAFGVAIKELRLLSRAIFVVGPDNRVDYVEYVEELADHPDYDAVLRAVKQAA